MTHTADRVAVQDLLIYFLFCHARRGSSPGRLFELIQIIRNPLLFLRGRARCFPAATLSRIIWTRAYRPFGIQSCGSWRRQEPLLSPAIKQAIEITVYITIKVCTAQSMFQRS
jgi:hypothetical protein